jgi:undecaprenyl diphosphate synthase
LAFFSSTTQSIPKTDVVPRHVAVIMDGNGRWAKKRFMPRVAGHKRGVETVRELVKYCAELKIEYLTLFAFSSENWRRPNDEVSFLMGLFLEALKREAVKLHQNNIKLVMIGDRSRFDAALTAQIEASEKLTAENTGLVLTIAANYGGRWDIVNAVNAMLKEHPEYSHPEYSHPDCHVDIKEENLAPYLSMSYAPEPDLFIRTGGENRISNFLLWQLAYTEFYFTETLWPDFNQEAFNLAITSYQQRERRFGRTSEQLIDPVS